MRTVALAALCAIWAGAAAAQGIAGADYVGPTDRYGHGAVGNGEWAGLAIRAGDGTDWVIEAEGAVFEDTAPRLADLDGDGAAEVVAVLSRFDLGAALQVWGMQPGAEGPMLLAETDPIGQRHRWLAIAAIADLDGDGRVEIAYVDRPHLARILRVIEVRTQPWALVPEAAAEGHTNHRLGSPVIEGGLRLCDGPEVVTASADWTRILATRLQNGGLVTRDLGPYAGADSMAAALGCG